MIGFLRIVQTIDSVRLVQAVWFGLVGPSCLVRFGWTKLFASVRLNSNLVSLDSLTEQFGAVPLNRLFDSDRIVRL